MLTHLSITRSNKEISFSTWNNTFQYQNLKAAELKWCYGFGSQSPEMLAEGGSGKSQARINAMNIVLILEFGAETIYIVEEIYMSEKFPHNIEYDETISLKAKKMFKLWNVEKCIKKLGIESFLK